MLPTFLGIGVPRGGTTWLHELLSTHPEIYMPLQRKEIHFFDRYYDRGVDWYEEFFPSDLETMNYKVVGEISPEYFYSSTCFERIAGLNSIEKFILMLRNPIDRAYSYYGMKVRNRNYSGSFEDFISKHPAAIQRGFYSQYLEVFPEYFERDQILVLITEKAVSDVANTKNILADFLDVSPELFPVEAGKKRVNTGYVTRAPGFYAFMVNTSIKLRKWDRLTDMVKRLGVKRLFATNKSLPRMKDETRQTLQEEYNDEICKLETMLSVNLDCWRSL